MIGGRGYQTWGDVFLAALARGEDPGYAAWVADNWEKRSLHHPTKLVEMDDGDPNNAAMPIIEAELLHREIVRRGGHV